MDGAAKGYTGVITNANLTAANCWVLKTLETLNLMELCQAKVLALLIL
jgi:hypothetical protein